MFVICYYQAMNEKTSTKDVRHVGYRIMLTLFI